MFSLYLIILFNLQINVNSVGYLSSKLFLLSRLWCQPSLMPIQPPWRRLGSPSISWLPWPSWWWTCRTLFCHHCQHPLLLLHYAQYHHKHLYVVGDEPRDCPSNELSTPLPWHFPGRWEQDHRKTASNELQRHVETDWRKPLQIMHLTNPRRPRGIVYICPDRQFRMFLSNCIGFWQF